MFASFVDSKILSQWEEPDSNLILFDRRIAELKAKNGASMVRTPTTENSQAVHITGLLAACIYACTTRNYTTWQVYVR